MTHGSEKPGQVPTWRDWLRNNIMYVEKDVFGFIEEPKYFAIYSVNSACFLFQFATVRIV